MDLTKKIVVSVQLLLTTGKIIMSDQRWEFLFYCWAVNSMSVNFMVIIVVYIGYSFFNSYHSEVLAYTCKTFPCCRQFPRVERRLSHKFSVKVCRLHSGSELYKGLCRPHSDWECSNGSGHLWKSLSKLFCRWAKFSTAILVVCSEEAHIGQDHCHLVNSSFLSSPDGRLD